MARAKVVRSARARVRVMAARARVVRARAARAANFETGRASADVGRGHNKGQAGGQQP
jgi:hypothetical protein